MDSLAELHSHYRKTIKKKYVWEDINDLYSRYVKEKGQAIIDAMASGVLLESILEKGSEGLTPQMEEAFNLAYPNVDIDSLSDRSPEELAGFLNGWKGKLFEVDVRDRLNDGEWVGDLHLDHGQIAELAESATQPGWDLAIIGLDGSVADHLQIKATDSLSYIKQALEKYPDIHILTTSEIGYFHDHLDSMISVSDIPNDHITDMVSGTFTDTATDSLLDVFLPGLPLAIIGITEGYGVLTGKRSKERAIERAVSRTGKGIVAGLAGWAISSLMGDYTGIAGGIAVRFLLGGEKDAPQIKATVVDYDWINKRLDSATQVPKMLLPYYS